jgi:YD repeat-containing protein
MKSLCYIGLFALMVGVLAIPAAAQSDPGCYHIGTGFVQPFPPYAFNCTYVTYTFSWDCAVRDKCPPPAAAQEVGICLKCLLAGNPISLATGDTFIEETDIKVPGLSNGLTLVRTWNSIWPSTQTSFQVGLFGPNWRSNFEERVFSGGDGYMKYARGDGSFWSFYYTGSGWSLAAPANVSVALVQGSSTWTLTFQNGEQRIFAYNSGNLTQIIDRNGNTTQLSYDATARLVTVTDPASRHLYFSYPNNSSFLVSSVTSDVGITLSYAYDTQGRLTQVTKQDGTTISFQYNSQSLISAVLDSNGVVLESHTYDSFGRGLTSSRAGGVDSVVVTYPNQ